MATATATTPDRLPLRLEDVACDIRSIVRRPAVGEVDLAVDLGRLARVAPLEQELALVADAFHQHLELSADQAAQPCLPRACHGHRPEPLPVRGSLDDEPEVELTKPSRIAKPKAAAKRRAATVTWVQGDDGGSRITKQIVRVYRGKKRVGAFRVPGDVTAVRVTGLKPRKVYRFTVIEKNALGKSPESARSNRVRPRR